MPEPLYTPSELAELPTLSTGQCCSLKIDTGSMRVWLCRVAGGVTIQRLRGGRWSTAQGSCTDPTGTVKG
jgi:hypothetical protein